MKLVNLITGVAVEATEEASKRLLERGFALAKEDEKKPAKKGSKAAPAK